MPRPVAADRTSPMTVSLPGSLQDRLRDHAARNPGSGGVSGIIRKLVSDFLDQRSPVETAAPPGPAETYTLYNAGIPAGLSATDWASIAAGAPLPEPQESARAFVTAHVAPNPQVTREQLREQMRLRDPEGYQRMQDEHEARLREALNSSQT